MRTFPFSAVVGSDDMALALILTAVSPEVGGVLVRGEKGTAKSTMVRALASVLPEQTVVMGCRFGCDPDDPDPTCPDGPHAGARAHTRSARLVELPVGATEDRVIGSLDLQRALGEGVTAYEPGLLAAAHRGLLYVDEVNLLHDHLVDLLLDAAAMGRSTVEREGVSVSHGAKFVLVGTMNPEEGELRPQLLDRFGLTVEIKAPRDPKLRTEVVRRRLAFDGNPNSFAAKYDDQEETLRKRISDAQARLPAVDLGIEALEKIAEICAAFDVDGMRADIVTARAAVAHAAWNGRTSVEKADIRAAARLALPHRRRRNPFDAPGLDEDLLDQILNDDPEPPHDPDDGGPDDQGPNNSDDTDGAESGSSSQSQVSGQPDATPQNQSAQPPQSQSSQGKGSAEGSADTADELPSHGPAPALHVAGVQEPYRTKFFAASGIGGGEAGRRSRAITSIGRTVGAAPGGETSGGVHIPATIRAAAPHQVARGRIARSGSTFRREYDGPESLRIQASDVRRSITEGRESNLVLFCVDASGSMAARKRMESVKTAVLSLLLDAYQRRDKVGLVTFRGREAMLALPPTSSVDTAARRLKELPTGGRTPLAEGLMMAERTLRLERLRDPKRRALLIVVTDGRATAGTDALAHSRRAAEYLAATGVDAIVVDCETGRFRMGLAGSLAQSLHAQYVSLDEVGASQLVSVAGGKSLHSKPSGEKPQVPGRAA